MPDHLIPCGTIVIDDEKIVDFGKKICTDGMNIVDANGEYTGPGLIDIHTHAGGGHLFVTDPVKASNYLLSRGITTVLPALYFSNDRDKLIFQAKKIKSAATSGECDNIFGLYMEAPYMNPEFGASKESCPWRGKIKTEDYFPLLEYLKGYAKVYVIAPERPGILEFVKDAKAMDPNVRFSVGHSKATPEDIEALLPFGLCNVTHHTNATGTLQKYPECRTACVDETALYNDTLYTELICDKVGIHVEPYILRLTKKIKGDDKIILISDASAEKGPIPKKGDYSEADDLTFDFEGEISGTKLTLSDACRNMMIHTGSSICQVFKYASTNPATMLGLNDRGVIKKGNIANLVTVDHLFNVKSVYLNGKKVR